MWAQRDIQWAAGAWALWLCDLTCHQVPSGCTAELTCLHEYEAQSAAIAPLRRGALRHRLQWGSLFWDPCSFSFRKNSITPAQPLPRSTCFIHMRGLTLEAPLSGSAHLGGSSGRGVFPALSKGGEAVKQRVVVHAQTLPISLSAAVWAISWWSRAAGGDWIVLLVLLFRKQKQWRQMGAQDWKYWIS